MSVVLEAVCVKEEEWDLRLVAGVALRLQVVELHLEVEPARAVARTSDAVPLHGRLAIGICLARRAGFNDQSNGAAVGAYVPADAERVKLARRVAMVDIAVESALGWLALSSRVV